MMKKKDKVIVIVGPTASGKSGLGIRVSQKINGEIISADSMQIYKNLNIGTAKVMPDEMQKIEHHLLDIIDVDKTYSVAEYKKACYSKIDYVLSKGKVPIIVGGTGLYINAVVNNLEFADEDTDSLKKEFNELYENKSLEELVNILKEQSRDTYNSVDVNNKRRVERALFKLFSQTEDGSKLWQNNGSKYEFLVFYIDIPRELLYDRINLRIDQMIKQGILEEAKFLYSNLETVASTAVQAIGYKEFFPYLSGQENLETCVENLKKATRHYAKRQVTWFKKLEPKIILDGTSNIEDICKKILGEYYEEKRS